MLTDWLGKTPAQASASRAIVRCEDDYERATKRIAEISMAEPGSDEERELIALVEAVEKWDARHDDETGWE